MSLCVEGGGGIRFFWRRQILTGFLSFLSFLTTPPTQAMKNPKNYAIIPLDVSHVRRSIEENHPPVERNCKRKTNKYHVNQFIIGTN